MSELNEIGREMLKIVAKRGYTGAEREAFFKHFPGIRYADLEREIKLVEGEGLIYIEWIGPSNFIATITPKGVDIITAIDESLWTKETKGLDRSN